MEQRTRTTPTRGNGVWGTPRACRSEDRRYAPKTEGKIRTLAKTARMRRTPPAVRGRKLARMRKRRGRDLRGEREGQRKGGPEMQIPRLRSG